MEAEDAVWTGSAQKPSSRNRQGHPGLERPQREGGDRDEDIDRELGSADKAGPAWLGRTG